MSYEHAVKMHNELAEQKIYGGDCFATSLDSHLVGEDLSDGFYYDILKAQQGNDQDRFADLIRQQIAKYFRDDHPAFDSISNLSVYCSPDGNPLDWGEPADQYEVVPAELHSLLEELPNKERDRVYGFEIDDETEEERRSRAENARDDANERLGIFVVARNLILDGVSLMPIVSQGLDGSSHVFAVTQNGLDDIHVVDVIARPGQDPNGYKQLARSPNLPLSWLCGVDDTFNNHPNTRHSSGRRWPKITSSNIPIDDSENWKYAVYAVPPQK